MRQGEIIISLCLIAVSAAIWISTAGFVPETSMASMNRTLGAAFYPRLVAACMFACSLLLLLRALRVSAGTASVSWNRWQAVPLAAAVMLLQAATFEELSWIPSAWLTLFLLMRMTKVRWWQSLAIPAGFIVFVYLFFILLLRLQFPTEFLPMFSG